MKKQVLKAVLLAALAGVVSAACARIPQPGPEGEGALPADGGTIVLKAEFSEPATRTMLSYVGGDERTYEVHWKTGDKISINGKLSNAVSSADNDKKTVTFTVSGVSGTPLKVLYPGTTSTNVISLPAEQTYAADNFDGAAAASYGNAVQDASGYSATMTNFCGVLRIALKGSATISKIEVNSLGSEKLMGNFTLTSDANGFTGAFSGGTAGTLTYTIPSGGVALSASTDKYFYIPIPAQHYASGIEALVYQDDGAFMRLKFWGSGRDLGNDEVVEFVSKDYAAGRTENLFSIADLNAEAGGEPTPSLRGITVATYNVLVQSSRTKYYADLSHSEVRTALGKAIAKTNADIIGFNELDDDYFEAGGTYPLKNIAEAQGFTGYTWELNHPDDIKEVTWLVSYSTSNKFADGFAYKTDLFDIADHNYVWLSHKADNTYYSARANAFGNCGAPETTCAYAKFTHKASGHQFYFFVTHTPTLDHTASEVDAPKVNGEYDKEDPDIAARRLRVLNNLKYFAASKAGSLPYIVVGDFNFGPYIDTKKTKVQPLYTAMTSGGFTNAYDEVAAAEGLAGIYVKYPGTETGSLWNYDNYLDAAKYPQFRIDHIFLHDGSSQGITAQSYKTIRETYSGTFVNGDTTYEGTWCPSDHFPVVSYITFD